MVLLWTATAHAYSPDICQGDEACRGHSERALSRAQSSDYHGALDEFTAAYAVQPEPRLLVNIGRCLFHLRRHHEALDHYRRFQKVPNFKPDPALKQACAEYITEAKEAIATARAAGIGYLVVTVAGSDTRVIIDGQEIGVAPLARTVELRAGRHRLELRGEHPLTSEVTIDAGNESSFSLDAPKEVTAAKSQERLRRPRWRIYAGAGAIGIGVLFVGLGAGALSVDGNCASQTAAGLCAAMVTPDGVRQAQVYDSTGMGAGLLVSGLLFTGAGIALIAWPGQKQETTRSSETGGAGLSWNF